MHLLDHRLGTDMNMPDGSARFDLWAPEADAITLQAAGQQYPMSRCGPGREGWWTAVGAPASGDVDYAYLVDGDSTPLPDPRSRRQPSGVHGLSRTFDAGRHQWADGQWRGRELKGAVIYELHVGTFTPDGTLEAATAKLQYLAELGID